MKPEYIVGAFLIGLVTLGVVALLFSPARPMEAQNANQGEPYHEIVNPAGFVNTENITIGELIGKKVVLVDFLTYSCINCQRTFPYLNVWYEKYKDEGLEIIGIHTPEFAFEKDIMNVQNAMREFGITHPIVLDNEYATWNAYGNRYWPRKYLIDIHGNIVYDHIGEGGYEETEMKIRALLNERATLLGEQKLDEKGLVSSGVPKTDVQTASPETYFGSDRNEYFANGTPGVSGEQYFAEPEAMSQNRLYLIGTWNITPEYAETPPIVGTGSVGSDRINYLYFAKSLFLVAGAKTATEVEVLLDSAPVPESMKGADLHYKNGRSYVSIQGDRLYQIIEGESAEKHLIEFIISNPGLRAFAFTFG